MYLGTPKKIVDLPGDCMRGSHSLRFVEMFIVRGLTIPLVSNARKPAIEKEKSLINSVRGVVSFEKRFRGLSGIWNLYVRGGFIFLVSILVQRYVQKREHRYFSARVRKNGNDPGARFWYFFLTLSFQR